MVAEQVFRARALVAAAGALAAAVATPAAAGEPTVLVDLRPQPAPDGGALAPALDERAEFDLRDEPALVAALAGAPAPRTQKAGEAELALAREAYGELDCEGASVAAEAAVLHLAGARAATPERDEVASALERAHVYQLLCAEESGRPDAAQLAAKRLRNLGVDTAPEGVSAEQWERLSDADATADVQVVPLTVTTEPAEARVWIDHEKAGRAPVEVSVEKGMHLVAAATDGARASATLEVEGPETAKTLSLEPTGEHWEELRRGITAWRQGREPTPVEISNMLQRLDAVILVVRREDSVELWGRSARAKVARRLTETPVADAAELAKSLGERASAWDPRPRAGPQPGVPLLREDPEEEKERDDDGEPSWWVYASILGAVGLGAGFVIANDLAEDRQRIELSWP